MSFITGDMDFVKEKKLVNILNRGTKFRINKKLNNDKVNSLFKKELDIFILKYSFTFNTQPILFHQWKISIYKAFEDFNLYLP